MGIISYMVKVEIQVSGGKIDFSTNGFGTAREPFGEKKKKLNLFLTLYLKINARWINVLNMKNKILKELEKNHRGLKIHNLGEAKYLPSTF